MVTNGPFVVVVVVVVVIVVACPSFPVIYMRVVYISSFRCRNYVTSRGGVTSAFLQEIESETETGKIVCRLFCFFFKPTADVDYV